MFPNTSNPCVTPLDFLQKGATIACVIQCGGLWFANGKFGITWKLIQAVGAKQRQSLTGKCLIKLKSSDKEKIRTAPVPDEVAEDMTLVEDSDGDDEVVGAAPVPAPAPTPAPASEADKPKKKVVKKKVAGAEA